jgi:hypothetical protein
MIGAAQDKLNTFGFELNESNSAINRRRIDLERSECMRNYPELFAEAATLVQERATRKKGR